MKLFFIENGVTMADFDITDPDPNSMLTDQNDQTDQDLPDGNDENGEPAEISNQLDMKIGGLHRVCLSRNCE